MTKKIGGRNSLNTDTWTPERIEQLTLLWDEGVPTAEMGRRLGLTKNQVIGKVQRLGLKQRTPQNGRPALAPRRNAFEFTGPVCMWPHGHPGENDFHFCGGRPIPGKPYCDSHMAIAYMKPKQPIAELVKGETNVA